jgi:hypothetical protein
MDFSKPLAKAWLAKHEAITVASASLLLIVVVLHKIM